MRYDNSIKRGEMMKLSQLTGKSVYVGSKRRGTCQGVGVALKNGEVKYLFCKASGARTDFFVNVSAIEEIDDEIYLAQIRPIFPKSTATVVLGLPVYSSNGAFLGNVLEMEMPDFIASCIKTDKDETLPLANILACSDAVLLRKKQPYPIGQRIPAPVVSEIFQNKQALVSRSALREAIQKGALIKLTLSLAPFEI